MTTKLCILLFIFTGTSPSWLLDFETATQQAKAENKVILLNFAGSDWCAPCIKLTREIFEKDEFLEFAQSHLVLVRADFPRLKKNQLSKEQTQHNEALAEKYNPQGKFPLTLLISADGSVLHEWDGYQATTPAGFVEQISKYIRE